MKQLLFLLLFPCLALAQYPGNAGQKITLGEQTSADGLVFRGVASIDTVTATSKITRANKQDTSAFLLLDTVTNLLWHYKTASNGWIQAGGGDTTSIAYVNTYGTQTVNGAKTFTSDVTGARFNPTASTVTGTGMYLPSANTVGFSTDGTKRMVITSRGDLGLNNNPSNWNTYTALQIAPYNIADGFISAAGNDTNIGTNCYYNSAWKYQSSGYGGATRYVQTGGEHQWFTAASGTADSLITFTEVIRIKNNGNVGIGTVNPTNPLEVVSSGGSVIITSDGHILTKQNADVATAGGRFTGQSLRGDLAAIHMEQTTTSQDGGFIDLRTSNNGSTTPTSKVRIAENGNVGIGTISPAVQFHTTGAVRFATFAGGGTTTLDVDNTGNLARTSSIELKKDVTPINYGLNQILQINPINFNWIDEDKYGNENENGFIAEDVMNVIPNVVGSDAHGLFMDYTKLIPILTKAIQEQQALIKALEQRILTLENK